jgi:cellobiose phosphorylase
MSTLEQYGRFIDSEGIFELRNAPPRKWVNLHYNQVGEHEIYSEITNIGDGTTWVRDGKGRTVVLVGYDAKYVYVRDDATNTVICPWGEPAPEPVTDRVCRYSAAKTEISGRSNGLRVTQRVFVPARYPVEVWTLTIDNATDEPRNVSVFGYAMFQLTGCDEEGRWVSKENYSEIVPEIGGVFVTNRNVEAPSDRFKGFLVTVADYAGASGYRDHFTRSDFGYGTPRILWGWNADNRPGFGPDCAGIVQVKLTIPARGTARADFLLGQAASVAEAKAIRDELTPERIDAACVEQEAREKARSEVFRVETGHPGHDGLMNHFVKKQLYSYLINKSGIRDNLQLDNALCLCAYKEAEENLLRVLAAQYPNGSMPHGFRPLNRLQYSDKPAWTMLTIPGLVKESGDLTLLDRVVPYFESSERGTVWDHMVRAMRFLAEDLGSHGLCRQHHADWNDGLEATREAGERESVMVTQQLCYGLLEVEELASLRGDASMKEEARQRYDELKKRLNDIAWDGRWYVRTFCGDGYRIGSSACEEGRIFLNTQSWAILSKTAEGDRALTCMQAVDELLTTNVGYRICAPSFSRYDPRVGRMSNSMPGNVENGGCYCHAAGFKAVAECMLGRAEHAYETFVKTLPDSPENPLARSHMEPFSFTNSFSQVPAVYGRSGYPWRTGTAAWFTVALLEWILGARRSFAGLLVAPCLSRSVPRARVLRTFRGARYDIHLDNTAGRCNGTRSIHVDGQPITGNVLPVFGGGEHRVDVVI